jgi:hypothetical protein
VFNLSNEQQKIFEEENPGVEDSQNWLAKSTSVTTSASELSSSEVSATSTSASDGDAPTPAKSPKKTQANDPTKGQKALPGSDSEAMLRKENKKLQVKIKKGEATASNLKKKMKHDSQALQIYIKQVRDANGEIDRLKQEMAEMKPDATRTKALLDKIKDMEETLKQSSIIQSDTQTSKLLETESKQEQAPSQTLSVDSPNSEGSPEPIVSP